LLSHEIAHVIGIKSEDGANKYATVASFVLVMIMKSFKKELVKELKQI